MNEADLKKLTPGQRLIWHRRARSDADEIAVIFVRRTKSKVCINVPTTEPGTQFQTYKEVSVWPQNLSTIEPPALTVKVEGLRDITYEGASATLDELAECSLSQKNFPQKRTNEYGLTWMQWCYAVGVPDEILGQPLGSLLIDAWLNGEDPADWILKFKQNLECSKTQIERRCHGECPHSGFGSQGD